MRIPVSPLTLLLFVFLLGSMIALIQLSLITFAFDRLGLSPASALLLLITSLVGSFINLPLFSLKSAFPFQDLRRFQPRWLFDQPQPFSGRTMITINVGGGLVPVCFCLYLALRTPLAPVPILSAIAIVTAVSYFLSRPLPGIGIGMPMLVAPITAALVAIFLGQEQRAAMAYIAGVLGVLIGADLLRTKDILQMGAPIASIGGAGTFDGIFITGLVAVLLT